MYLQPKPYKIESDFASVGVCKKCGLIKHCQKFVRKNSGYSATDVLRLKFVIC